MPASVSTPSTSVANKRMPRRIPCREAGDFDGVLARRVVLGMRRLSGAMLTSHHMKLKNTHPGAKRRFQVRKTGHRRARSVRMPVDEPSPESEQHDFDIKPD